MLAGRHGLSMLRRQYRDVQPHLHPFNALGLGSVVAWKVLDVPLSYSCTYRRYGKSLITYLTSQVSTSYVSKYLHL